MRNFFKTMIILGIPHWVVSVIEFVFYKKTSGSLILATVLFIFGFGGLVIYNKIKGIR